MSESPMTRLVAAFNREIRLVRLPRFDNLALESQLFHQFRPIGLRQVLRLPKVSSLIGILELPWTMNFVRS